MDTNRPPLVQRDYHGKPLPKQGTNVSSHGQYAFTVVAQLLLLKFILMPVFLFIWAIVAIAIFALCIGPGFALAVLIPSIHPLASLLCLAGFAYGIVLNWRFLKWAFFKADKYLKINFTDDYHGPLGDGSSKPN